MSVVLHELPPDTGAESGSPFCVKIHRVLAFKGIDYVPRAVASPGEIKRLNPGVNKLPVLDWHGELISDSTRIAHHLDAVIPEPPLLPEDPPLRARCVLLQSWADESLYWFAVYYRWAVDESFVAFRRRFFDRALPLPLRWFVPRLVRRQVRVQLHGQGLGRLPEARVRELLGGHLQMLDALLADGPFFFGERCTLADISVFAPLRQLALDVHPQSAALVAEHPTLRAWLTRVDAATAGPHTVPFP